MDRVSEAYNSKIANITGPTMNKQEKRLPEPVFALTNTSRASRASLTQLLYTKEL